MKLPNGYGTVYKLTGNRRRPWVVKKTIDGRQRPLGYFANREEAFAFLVSVNRMTPGKEITFSALYHAWSRRHFEAIGASSRSAYEISYKHLSPLHSLPFARLTYQQIQSALDSIEAGGYCTKKKCRVLLSQLFQYAMKNGIVETDLSRFIELPRHVPVYTKRPFTSRQIGKLWKSADTVKGVKDVLILIYTGMRAGEYISLAAGDVNLRQQYINVKKSKTLAGIRKIPIHKKILPILSERKAKGAVCSCGNYESFRRLFDHAMKEMKMHHTPHECRHTLATMLDRAGANETAVKMILGHARTGVTKGVYTHKTLADLKKAINKV